MPGQKQDILTTLAQRRDSNGIHAYAVIQIRAESTCSYFLLQVAVGRSQDPDVDALRLVRTDSLDLASLQRAQELGLHR